MTARKPAHPMRIKRSATFVILVALSTGVILNACGGNGLSGNGTDGTAAGPMRSDGRAMGMGHGMMRGYPGGMMGSSMQRHRWAMMGGIPVAYRGLRNPLPPDPPILSEGRSLYQANCAACHGESGLGDGPAAAGLSPPPANLQWTLARPMASDGYLMWAISEGGSGLGTPMPAFKDTLSETDRWKIIRFLRSM